MKLKELKRLAEKIADHERVIQTTQDADERKKSEQEILKLSSKVKDMADILTLDELIQEILEKNS